MCRWKRRFPTAQSWLPFTIRFNNHGKDTMIPGEYFLASESIAANSGREQITILVRHTGDRPIQIGSHYHFFEVNRALAFDRAKARGMRLNVPGRNRNPF